MKFDESSLTEYLVKHLQPLTEADPVILAEYVVALLKKDKPAKELQDLCTDNLVEFLGEGTKSFITRLFEVLEDGSILRSGSAEALDVTRKIEPSQSPAALDVLQLKNLPARDENNSTSSEALSDPDEKEPSDDDDDDRNHKHRRREARPNSFDKDGPEQVDRMLNRKRKKPYENGQLNLQTDSRSSEFQKDYNPSERGNSSKFEKRRSGLAQQSRVSSDLGSRSRVGPTFRSDLGSRFDLSNSVGRPSVGRGRGRGTPWIQHDSRFNPLETLDFASHMVSQGPPHPSLFVGAGLPGAARSQTASWGSFGFIPGMSTSILDPLHPLGLSGTIGPTVAPPLNLPMPQRCRDFEERGFCLRGDMCPMEHGINRIVVEDVQSLSQFNLPVSIPTSRAPGIQGGTGHFSSVSAPSGHNNNAAPSRNNKPGVTADALEVNGVLSSGGGEPDVYDPDQPLWNNDRPATSNALLRLQSPNHNDEPSWDADSSNYRSFAGNVGSESRNSSVLGRIGSTAKSETASKIEHNVIRTGYLETGIKEDNEELIVTADASNQVKESCNEETSSKLTGSLSVQRPRTHPGRNGGKPLQKASRTLYVNGIPQKNNRREALLSHFGKFGEVIDVYIPLHSEKAFVQFSKREEAEAALRAPDAVMGNRFIKLFWANRDRISDVGQSSSYTNNLPPHGLSVASHPSVADRGKQSLSTSAQKGSACPAAEASIPIISPSKNLKENELRTANPVQKKVETLELLKDEIRRKQEMLAQKRDEFRRQLDKIEKKAGSVKKGDEQTIQRPKMDKDTELAKASTPRPPNSGTMEACQGAEKSLEKRNSGEILVSPTPKANSTIPHQSPKDARQSNRHPVPVLNNRFKLDNRPASFRVLPPLPDELANDISLREHFSSFGDLASIVLQDPEVSAERDFQPSQARSACVNFTTRHSAEKAFFEGKYWKGHTLKFMWLTISPKSSNGCPTKNVSPALKGILDAGIQSKTVASDPDAWRSTSNVIFESASTGKDESNMDMECTNFPHFCAPEALIQACVSDTCLPAVEKQPRSSDNSMIEDNVNNSSPHIDSNSCDH